MRQRRAAAIAHFPSPLAGLRVAELWDHKIDCRDIPRATPARRGGRDRAPGGVEHSSATPQECDYAAPETRVERRKTILGNAVSAS